MGDITRFPGPVIGAAYDADDDGAFTSDQVETLAVALAGLKGELSDAIGDRIAAAHSIAKIELGARLAGVEDTVRAEFNAALAEKFVKFESALKDELLHTIDNRIKAAQAIAHVALDARLTGAEDTIRAELHARLASAEDTARTELHGALEKKFAGLRDAITGELNLAVEKRIAAAVRAFREETDLNLGAVRSELLARIDDKNFGLMLSDVDPRMLERSLRE